MMIIGMYVFFYTERTIIPPKAKVESNPQMFCSWFLFDYDNW